MSPEAKKYSPAQLGFQRLLVRESKHLSEPGDGIKRASLNFAIGGISTLGDLLESHLADKFMRKPMERAVDQKVEAARLNGFEALNPNKFKDNAELEAAFKSATPELQKEAFKSATPELQNAAQATLGKALIGEFVEEWASDGIYAGVANSWARLMTGKDGVKYVSETAAFVSDWANVISQVFINDKLYPRRFVNSDGGAMRGKFNVKLAYKTMDFINPVNVEAALRVVEEVPVLGNGVAWLHEKTDHLLDSTLGRISQAVAGKGILGYHIGKNVIKL